MSEDLSSESSKETQFSLKMSEMSAADSEVKISQTTYRVKPRPSFIPTAFSSRYMSSTVVKPEQPNSRGIFTKQKSKPSEDTKSVQKERNRLGEGVPNKNQFTECQTKRPIEKNKVRI